jgi:hypothetical protein
MSIYKNILEYKNKIIACNLEKIIFFVISKWEEDLINCIRSEKCCT